MRCSSKSGAPAPVPAQYHVGDLILPPSAGPGDRLSAPVSPRTARSSSCRPVPTTSPAPAPGIYTLASGGPPRRFAVNCDATESCTAPLPADELERLGVPLAREETASAREARRLVRLQDADLESRQRSIVVRSPYWRSRSSRTVSLFFCRRGCHLGEISGVGAIATQSMAEYQLRPSGSRSMPGKTAPEALDFSFED